MRKLFALLTLLMSLILSACQQSSTISTLEGNNSLLPTPLPTSISVESSRELTIEVLKNAEYHSPIQRDGFKLENGIYYLTPFPGESPDDWYIRLDEPIAFGDINGDGINDAVVVLKSRGGGTGVFRCIAAVVNQKGQANNVATQCLSDRDRIVTLTIDKGLIVADVLVHGPHDAACCPTVEATWTYKLIGNELQRDDE